MSRTPEDLRRALFAQSVHVPDRQIQLALSGLIFAADRYPDLDITAELGRLDALAEDARPHVPTGDGAKAALSGLGRYLAWEQGFNGTPEAYRGPTGCFLNETLQTHTGLPITLSAVYLEVGWRLGVPLEGVGLPGHFVIKYRSEDEELFADPFNGGRILTADDCCEIAREQLGEGHYSVDEFLRAASRRAILYRMLNNLKSMYLSAGNAELALWATDRMLILNPDSLSDLRDRGLLRHVAGQYAKAITDLSTCLVLGPELPEHDRTIITTRLSHCLQESGALN